MELRLSRKPNPLSIWRYLLMRFHPIHVTNKGNRNSKRIIAGTDGNQLDRRNC